jgi:hypothetical protein
MNHFAAVCRSKKVDAVNDDNIKVVGHTCNSKVTAPRDIKVVSHSEEKEVQVSDKEEQKEHFAGM